MALAHRCANFLPHRWFIGDGHIARQTPGGAIYSGCARHTYPVLAKQWRLVIAGDGPEEENLADLIERHGLTEHIRLLGNIGNIADWLEEAEIYVHSAEFEGFPNSLIEAMAHHTACLSVDCPVGPGEVIEHELNGLLASPKDPEKSLVAPLLTLMGDPNLRQQYAEEAMKVISRLDAHNIAQKWLDLFASLKH